MLKILEKWDAGQEAQSQSGPQEVVVRRVLATKYEIESVDEMGTLKTLRRFSGFAT